MLPMGKCCQSKCCQFSIGARRLAEDGSPYRGGDAAEKGVKLTLDPNGLCFSPFACFLPRLYAVYSGLNWMV